MFCPLSIFTQDHDHNPNLNQELWVDYLKLPFHITHSQLIITIVNIKILISELANSFHKKYPDMEMYMYKNNVFIPISLCIVEMFVELNKTDQQLILCGSLESHQMLFHGLMCVYLGALWHEKAWEGLERRNREGKCGWQGFWSRTFYKCCDYSEAQSRSHTLGLLAQRAGVFSLCGKISRLRVLWQGRAMQGQAWPGAATVSHNTQHFLCLHLLPFHS